MGPIGPQNNFFTYLGSKNHNFGPIDLEKKRYCRKFARESIATIKSDLRAIFRELETILDPKITVFWTPKIWAKNRPLWQAEAKNVEKTHEKSWISTKRAAYTSKVR